MGSSSKSNASTSNKTSNEDNRVASESGVALGKGASLTYTEQVSDNLVELFGKVVSFAEKSATTAEGVSQLALEKAYERADRSEKGALTGFTDTLPVLMGLAGIVAVGWVIVSIFGGKGRKK